MNLVVISHPNVSGKYLFQVPNGVSLKAGCIVVCATSKDPAAIGICATDSFETADPEKIAGLWNTTVKQLKPVTGHLALRDYGAFWDALLPEDTP